MNKSQKLLNLIEDGMSPNDPYQWPQVGDPIYYKNKYYTIVSFQGGYATLRDESGNITKVKSLNDKDWLDIEDASDHNTDPAGGSGRGSHESLSDKQIQGVANFFKEEGWDSLIKSTKDLKDQVGEYLDSTYGFPGYASMNQKQRELHDELMSGLSKHFL